MAFSLSSPQRPSRLLRAAAGLAVAAAGSWRAALAFAAAERDRWPLWLPVGLAGGIAVYFAWPSEPSAALAVAAVGLGLVLSILASRLRRPGALALAVAALAAAIGFAAATARTALVAAPVLADRLGPVAVEGRVVAAELRDGGARVVLADPYVARLAPERTPARIRLRLARSDALPAIGERLRLRAVLLPPAPPALPGAYDFARHAYFERIGAVGYALGRAQRLAPVASEAGLFGDIAVRIAALRQAMDRRVMAAVPGAAGAMTAALITGEQAAIPRDVMAAMRDAGLSHLLAISGFNVALVAGALFLTFRLLLALTGRWALLYPAKKWAAAATLVGIVAYTLITGASVPTVRACLMAAVVLLAVMIDRTALSMRLVMAAAAVLLLVAPESLLGASFQMSFAAVVALIAAYEASRGWALRQRAGGGTMRRAGLHLGGILATTIIAGCATAPFAAFHFNQFAVYQLAANLVAVPLTAIWIMPWSLLVYLLMPLGLEAWALAPMSLGVEGLIAIAEGVAAWPSATLLLPSLSSAGLALVSLGGLWLCLWRRRWRWAGVPVVLLGLSSLAVERPPDLLIAAEGGGFAARAGGGELVFANVHGAAAPGQAFLRDVWQRRAGIGPADDGATALRCDAVGCGYRRAGHVVALVRDDAALAEDCAIADVVVSWAPVARWRCPGPRLILDRARLRDGGTHALWLDRPDILIATVRDARGARPWSVGPPR